MKAKNYPGFQELIMDTDGHIRKVLIDFNDYQRLLEATEDEGLLRGMIKVKDETPLSLEEVLTKLESEPV